MTTPAKTAPAKGAKSTAKKTAAPRKQAEPKPAKHCLHGCGVQTKGGDFAIGHDAKLKSLLQKAHVEGVKAVDLGGKDASPYHGQAPMEIAKQRGWEKYLTDAATRATEKANRPKRQATKKVKGGPVEVGTSVEFTYRGGKHRGEVTEVSGNRARVKFEIEGKAESRAFGVESLTALQPA